MTATWISPWSGEQLSEDELIREVALDALSQLYIVCILGFPAPDVVLGTDAVNIKSSAIDYEYVIPYPGAVAERMERAFSDALLSLRQEYGFLDGTRDCHNPRGDQIGGMLRHFKALDRLIRIVCAARCWDEQKVIAVHGIPTDYSPSSLKGELKAAGFHYLVMYPEDEPSGSGSFTVIDMPTAISLVNSLWARKARVVEELFDLEKDYGRHQWLSDDSLWTAQGPGRANEHRIMDSP